MSTRVSRELLGFGTVMTEITLVRHGQANTGAASEEEYDRLSALGHQQARWLGEYFKSTEQSFDHVLHGSLNRQRDTADAICNELELPRGQDTRLNELDYFGLTDSLRDRLDVPHPDGREAFIEHVPQVLHAWRTGKIETPVESFEQFETRVSEMLSDAQGHGGRVLLVTSGGIISMMMRMVLGLDDAGHAGVLLQTRNGSYHRFRVEAGRVLLEGFNAVPHLEGPERVGAKTFI